MSILLFTSAASGQNDPPITTVQYNNDRTSANTSETILNTGNVNSNNFGKLFSWQVDGYVFAQPLYVPNVNGKNVVYVATMNNSVYAFDSSNSGSTPIWKTRLGTPVSAVTMSCPIFNSGSNGKALGILSTPVIDTSTNTLYAVSSNPGNGGYVMNLYAIDIITGNIKAGPTQIAGPTGTIVQRTGLVLANNNIYAAFGSCGNDSGTYAGTVSAFDESTLSQVGTFNDLPSGGNGEGIWQSGGGGVVDGSGNVYYNSGNDLVGGSSSGDSVLKLSPSVSLASSFTPSNSGQLDQFDLDLSSAGPLQLPGGLLVSGGKFGAIFLLNESNLDGNPIQSFQATQTCTNFSIDSCFQIHHLAFWNNTLYVWGGQDILRAYTFANGSFNTTPAWTQNITLSDKRWAPLAVSANGTDASTGILWGTTDTGVVHAFNATTGAELWNSIQNSSRDSVPSSGKFGVPLVANGRLYVVSNSCVPAQQCSGINQVAVFGLLPQADFTISITPASQTVAQGSSTTYTVNVTPVNGFNGTVALSVPAGLPSSVTVSFNPSSITNGSGSSTLTLTASGSASLGNVALTIQGVSGALTHTTGTAVTVQQSAPPDAAPPTWSCCTVINPDPSNYVLQYTAQDTGSGMASIVVTQEVNASANIPAFTPGVTDPIQFTTTECCGWSSYISLQLTDIAGNAAFIDPWHVIRQAGPPQTVQSAVHKYVVASQRTMHVKNGAPGVKNLRVTVNGVDFHLAGLKDGDEQDLDISSALNPTDDNTVTVSPLGKPGGYVDLLLIGSRSNIGPDNSNQ